MSSSETSTTQQQALELLQELRVRLAAVERMVAPPPIDYVHPSEDLTVLIVRVNGFDAAISVRCVEEVVPYALLTPIPESPGWVAGILDLGGRTISVLDVAARLSGRTHCPRVDDFIVVCRVESRLIGLCVEQVRDVISFPPEAITPPPTDAVAGPYLIATIRSAESPILLFSVEQLVRVAELPPITEEAWQPSSTC